MSLPGRIPRRRQALANSDCILNRLAFNVLTVKTVPGISGYQDASSRIRQPSRGLDSGTRKKTAQNLLTTFVPADSFAGTLLAERSGDAMSS
jgi:hypothetical protein